jgi:hypothetical protein
MTRRTRRRQSPVKSVQGNHDPLRHTHRTAVLQPLLGRPMRQAGVRKITVHDGRRSCGTLLADLDRCRPDSAAVPAILAGTWRWRAVSTRNPDPACRPARRDRDTPRVTTGRDRARSGVDAVRCRRDDLRPAGMTRSRPQFGPPARSRRPMGAAQPGGRQAAGSWAACRPAVVRLPRLWRGLEDVSKVITCDTEVAQRE